MFAAITGSASATIAAVGGLMIPAMIDSNYQKSFSMGLVASAGSLGILIPPSIPMILYTTIAGVSVSKLFAAGMLPGLIVVGVFSIYIVIFSIIHKQRGGETEHTDRWKKTLKALPAILLPVAILGSIYSGIMTATEASAFACVYAVLVSTLIYREYTWGQFIETIKEATKSTATILWIVTACSMFPMFLTATRVPHQILEIVAASNFSAIQMVVICALILIFLGCFMDGVSIMLIAAPLMVPVVGGLGYDLIQFGIVMTIGIQVGQLTPPVGINLFQVAGMQKESVASVIRGAVPFLLLLMAVWVLVIFCPGLTAVATTLFT